MPAGRSAQGEEGVVGDRHLERPTPYGRSPPTRPRRFGHHHPSVTLHRHFESQAVRRLPTGDDLPAGIANLGRRRAGCTTETWGTAQKMGTGYQVPGTEGRIFIRWGAPRRHGELLTDCPERHSDKYPIPGTRYLASSARTARSFLQPGRTTEGSTATTNRSASGRGSAHRARCGHAAPRDPWGVPAWS